MYDVIIVGGGPAGLTAAIYTSRANLATLVIEKFALGGQTALTYKIDNYPGFKSIYGNDLASDFESHVKESGATIVIEEAIAIDLDGEVKTVTTNSGRYEAKSIILALGSSRKKLGVPGEEEFSGKGVSYCATCDGNFFKKKNVAVIGGGNTAVGYAIELSEICSQVTLIYHGTELPAVSSQKDQILSHSNIRVLYNTETLSILGSDRVERVSIKNVKTGKEDFINADGVFVAIGINPNSQILNEQILFPNKYIRSDEKGVTPIEGVFAAGDLREKQLYQIVTAMSDGANAAYSAQLYLEKLK